MNENIKNMIGMALVFGITLCSIAMTYSMFAYGRVEMCISAPKEFVASSTQSASNTTLFAFEWNGTKVEVKR